MKRNRFLAGLLSVCLLAGSIPINTYAAVLNDNKTEITLPEDELTDDSETQITEETVVDQNTAVESESELVENSKEETLTEEESFEFKTEAVSSEQSSLVEETDSEQTSDKEEKNSEEVSEETTADMTDETVTTESDEEETEIEVVTETGITAEAEADVVFGDGISVKANSGLGMLLMEDLQNAQEELEEEMVMQYCISDITMEQKTATVTLNAIAACKVVVGIYEEDTDKLLAYGVADVSAGQNQIEVEIQNGEIPQYYEVKGYVVNDSLRPLSKEYTTNMYTQAMQEFLSKRKEDFDEDKVITLDEAVETNFAVVSDGNTLIVYETGVNELVSYDEESNTYVFENVDEKITSLQTGDIFVYQYEETNLIAIQIADISIENTTATIVAGTEKLAAEDVFEYIRIDEQVDNSSTVIEQSDCLSGVTYLGKLDEDGNPIGENVTYGMRSVSGEISKEFFI